MTRCGHHGPGLRRRIHEAGGAALAVVVLLFTAALADAQPPELPGTTGVLCETTVSLENRNRRVFGTDIHAECGGWPHSAPFGNWGVNSNHGTKRNWFQFPGWHKDCSWGFFYCNLRQWNSCTRRYTPYTHPQYYHPAGSSTQISKPDDTASYGGFRSRGSVGQTCSSLSAVVVVHNNRMELRELDAPGRDQLVATLTYPSLSAPVTCPSAWHCTGSSPWVSASGGASAVSADIRIRVSRQQVTCTYTETGDCY